MSDRTQITQGTLNQYLTHEKENFCGYIELWLREPREKQKQKQTILYDAFIEAFVSRASQATTPEYHERLPHATKQDKKNKKKSFSAVRQPEQYKLEIRVDVGDGTA